MPRTRDWIYASQLQRAKCTATGTAPTIKTRRGATQSDFQKRCESNSPNKNLCQLPPLPRYGGYMAVNRPGGKPGDVFENVTLISFITDENSELAAVTRHACSSGAWAHKSISDSGACSPLYSEKGIKSENEYKFSPSTKKRCVLSEYPENGSYIVINDIEAGPGDAFDDISLILYTSDEYFALEIVYLACARGAWSREILKRVPRPIGPWSRLINQEANPNSKFSSSTIKSCVLPKYPENGSYIVINDTEAGPGDAFDDLSLIMYTSDEYFALEVVYLACARGAWNREIIKHVPRPIGLRNDLTNQEANPNTNTRINLDYCKLPPYPEHGLYVVAGDASAKPGDERASASLEYACRGGYSLVGKWRVRCENGTWHDDAPQCLNTTETPGSTAKTRSPMQNVPDICELPMSPEHGEYYVFNKSHDGPGDNYTFLHLLYQCEYGYGIVGDDKINCSHGVWSDVLPTCISGCRLNYDADVHYLCKKWRSEEFSEEFCNVYIPNGEEVLPVCDTPYYRSDKDLPPMKCVDGNWNYTPACLPECGVNISKKKIPKHLWVDLLAPDGRVSRGRSARSKELPWHVGIYYKMYKPYKQICGGTIISAEVVVTAAHCFWKDVEGLEPSRRFAVAAGKLYRRWTAPSDSKAQLRDVNKIVIPKRFRGGLTNFQDDIAIVYLSKPLSFNEYVWPVCFDFDWKLDQSQLTAGNLGKVAGWGLIDEDGHRSPELQVAYLPYVEIDQCISDASLDFRAYITSDKICAGYTNGTALCKGDSGGGLVFVKEEGQLQRHYLRGISSTAPNNNKLCNTHAIPTFTHILAHERFIKDQLNFTIV